MDSPTCGATQAGRSCDRKRPVPCNTEARGGRDSLRALSLSLSLLHEAFIPARRLRLLFARPIEQLFAIHRCELTTKTIRYQTGDSPLSLSATCEPGMFHRRAPTLPAVSKFRSTYKSAKTCCCTTVCTAGTSVSANFTATPQTILTLGQPYRERARLSAMLLASRSARDPACLHTQSTAPATNGGGSNP
ncbi:hypothetical protein Bbelb_174100 [Branchiostoma belcheri]|nr:hypothetical protein Bbelb_174100 [Branchiostoma belcheri]